LDVELRAAIGTSSSDFLSCAYGQEIPPRDRQTPDALSTFHEAEIDNGAIIEIFNIEMR
jgi:hypothetical protein